METLLWILFELAGGLLLDVPWSGSAFNSGGGRIIRTPAAAISGRGPCAFCKKPGGRFVTCRACRTPHHRDCAQVNGRCAVYGCANRKFLVPAA